jgi:hypothetical protein
MISGAVLCIQVIFKFPTRCPAVNGFSESQSGNIVSWIGIDRQILNLREELTS